MAGIVVRMMEVDVSPATVANTGEAVSAYMRLGLGLVGFGGSVLGLAWLFGGRRSKTDI